MADNQSSRVYLDWSATAPMGPAAVDAFAGAARVWANPSSVHADGRGARAALEDTRGRIARALGASGNLVFTSGASEAIGIALGRANAASRIVGATEHRAVCAATPDAAVAPVDGDGRIDPAELDRLLAASPPRVLVAVQHANNETGVIQPIAEVARLARAHGALLLVDAVQSAMRLPWPEADFVAVSAHKLGGPPGIGVLFVRDPATLSADGGGQERGYRMGTENLPGALAFAAALEARAADAGWTGRVASLRAQLEARLADAGAMIAGRGIERVPHITSARMVGVESMRQLMLFDLEGFSVSAGAACSSGTVKASPVLRAMGWSEEAAGEACRISLGWTTTEADIEAFAAAWARIADRLQRRAA